MNFTFFGIHVFLEELPGDPENKPKQIEDMDIYERNHFMTSKTRQTAPSATMKQIRKADARELLRRKINLIRALNNTEDTKERSFGEPSERFLDMVYLAEVESRLELLLSK